MRRLGHFPIGVGILLLFSSIAQGGDPPPPDSPTRRPVPALSRTVGEASQSGPRCESLIVAADELGLSGEVDHYTKALFEEHDLDNLITLAAEHPSIAWNTYQRAFATVARIEPITRLDSTFRSRKVTIWPALSRPDSINDGRYIIGHERVNDQLVSDLEAGAKGDGSVTKKLHRLVGGPGTGKTEFMVSLTRQILNLALKDSRYFWYTFKFVGLEEVPELAQIFGSTGEFRNPINESPIVLLPPALQQRVIEAATPLTREITRGSFDPMPILTPNLLTRAILRSLYESKFPDRDLNANPLTVREELDVMREHVRIVRRVTNPSDVEPIIRYLGDNPRVDQLLMGVNPRSRLNPQYGQSHPFSKIYAGELLALNGLVVGFDELSRNEASILNLLLEGIQNGTWSADGSSVVLDAVYMAADNVESVDGAAATGNTDALSSRTTDSIYEASVHPHEITHALLHMDAVGKASQTAPSILGMRDLSADDPTKILPYDATQVFPETGDNSPLAGLHRRYVIVYGRDPATAITISPHSLLMLSATASITRMETDYDKFKKEGIPKLGRDLSKEGQAVFRDPTQRIDFMMGERHVEDQTRIDIAAASVALKEGAKGIDPRSLQDWARKAREIAIDEHARVVTPAVVDAAFNRWLTEYIMRTKGGEAKSLVKWRKALDIVKHTVIYPRIRADVMEIIVGGGDYIQAAYLSVVGMSRALLRNPDSKTFDVPGRSEKEPFDTANRKKLEEIKKIFKRNEGRDLTFEAVAVGGYNPTPGSKDEPWPPLMKAVQEWVMSQRSNMEDLRGLAEAFEGASQVSPEIARKVQSIEPVLGKYGYDNVSIREAFRFVRTIEAEREERDSPPRN